MRSTLAEIRKVFAGQTWWAFMAVGVLLCVMTVVAITPDHAAAVRAGTESVRLALDDATRYWMTLYLAAGCLIAYLVADEFRDGQMQRSVLLQRLSRARVLGTKFAAAIVVAALFGVVAAALAWVTPPLVVSAFGMDPTGYSVDLEIVAGVFGTNVLAGVWGFALGVLLRNAAVAVVVFVVQTVGLETYGAKALPEVGQYMFTSALGSLYKAISPCTMAILPALGIALAWVTAAMLASVITFRVRDV